MQAKWLLEFQNKIRALPSSKNWCSLTLYWVLAKLPAVLSKISTATVGFFPPRNYKVLAKVTMLYYQRSLGPISTFAAPRAAK